MQISKFISASYSFLKRFPKRASFLSSLFVVSAIGAAYASDITVGSPINGNTIPSPVLVKAHNIGCNGLAPTAFGYSIDDATGIVKGVTAYDIDVPNQGVPNGTHIVHFKSWTAAGACPVVNSQFVVSSATSLATPGIPATARATGNLDSSYWNGIHDGGTPGGSKGSTVFPSYTPVYDDALEFYMTYYDHGGQRWSVRATTDAAPMNIAIDTYIYLTDPAQVQNIELDVNQVTSTGETVILGTQCSSITGTWESAYTSGHYDHWWASGIKCNPHNWAANQWHHVQIGMHRDSNGVVTHDWVNLDGTHSVFHDTPRTSFQKLGWPPGAIVVNYQIEGQNAGSGSVKSYVHKMMVYRW